MNISNYLDINPPQIIETFPKYSFVLSTAMHPNGHLAIVLGFYYTPVEILDPDFNMTHEEVIALVSSQKLIGQICLPKHFLQSDMFKNAINEVLRS